MQFYRDFLSSWCIQPRYFEQILCRAGFRDAVLISADVIQNHTFSRKASQRPVTAEARIQSPSQSMCGSCGEQSGPETVLFLATLI